MRKRTFIIIALFFSIFMCLNCNKKDPTENEYSSTVTDTMTDINGNIYQTVKIGSQWRMAENLNVTRYRNAAAILKVTDSTEWIKLSTGAYCVYNNHKGNGFIKKFQVYTLYCSIAVFCLYVKFINQYFQ